MFYREGLLAPRPTPKLEDHPLVGCPRLLIQFIRSHPPYWRCQDLLLIETWEVIYREHDIKEILNN